MDKEHFIPPIIPLDFKGKNEFLYYVGAKYSVKADVRWRCGFQLLVKNLNKQGDSNPKKKQNRKPRVKKAGINLVNTKLTKVECNSLKQEHRQMMKLAWSSGSDESTDKEDGDISIPSNFKRSKKDTWCYKSKSTETKNSKSVL